jgi:hypothetical protein
VSDRISKARFDSMYVKTTVDVCYTPTNSAADDVKEKYCNQLQAEISGVSSHNVLIVGGDMNVKVEADSSRRERCKVRFVLGQVNENRHLFTDFCLGNELVIEGALFEHKYIHRYTWESPDGVTRNQINHVAIS